MKQGHVMKNWKRRWFALKDKVLYYFDSDKFHKKPKGIIVLENYVVQIVDDPALLKKMKKTEATLFILKHHTNPHYLLCADNEESMQNWVNAILLEFCRDFIGVVDVKVARATFIDEINMIAGVSQGEEIKPFDVDDLSKSIEQAQQSSPSTETGDSRQPLTNLQYYSIDQKQENVKRVASKKKTKKTRATQEDDTSAITTVVNEPLSDNAEKQYHVVEENTIGEKTVSGVVEMKISTHDEETTTINKTTIVEFINDALHDDSYLKRFLPLKANNDSLFLACRDGVLLCKFLNLCVRNTIHENVINTTGLDKVERCNENHTLMLLSAQSVGCFVDKLSNEDILGAKSASHSKVLNVMGAMVRAGTRGGISPLDRHPKKPERLSIEKPISPKTNHTTTKNVHGGSNHGTGGLLRWCQMMTCGYKGVDVHNFTTTWSDGRALLALLHRFFPDDVSFAELAKENVTPTKRFDVAFDISSRHGVEPLLETEDIVGLEIPDKLSVITYLAQVYKVCASKPCHGFPKHMNSDSIASIAVPLEVVKVDGILTSIESRLQNITDAEIVDGVGIALNNELTRLSECIKSTVHLHPELMRSSLVTYNRLVNAIPAAVNAALDRVTESTVAKVCTACSQELSGQIVELTGGTHWHKDCFACQECYKSLADNGSCLNINGHPYCTSCGRHKRNFEL